MEANRKAALQSQVILAFVDGSYNASIREFSYGVVFLEESQNEVLIKLSGRGRDTEAAKLKNIAGKLLAAEQSMIFCVNNGYNTLRIYYEYDGIEKWCTNNCKINSKIVQEYKGAYLRYSKK